MFILNGTQNMKNLPKSYKNVYPFRLAATSFIYPADYTYNVRRLGPFVDEIELLLFESRPDALPTPAEIGTLVRLGEEFGLTYNIHLPYDVSACDPDPDRRRRAVDTILGIVDLAAPLSPTTHTLHLPYDGSQREKWQRRAEESISMLVHRGVEAEALSIETLDYPFEWLEGILDAYTLRTCIDIGHLIVQEVDPAATLDRYRDRTAVVHLHGADGKKDHLALGCLPTATSRPIVERLRHFNGTVSIEVFSFDRLAASLSTFEKWWAAGRGRRG